MYLALPPLFLSQREQTAAVQCTLTEERGVCLCVRWYRKFGMGKDGFVVMVKVTQNIIGKTEK